MLVLVVEDDADFRGALVEALEADDLAVVVASDGKDAIDRLEGGLRPSVILLDLLMPGIDGVEFRKRQLLSEYAGTPVVAMTGDVGRAGTLVELGVAAVLIKPVAAGKILDALRTAGGAPGKPESGGSRF